MISFLRHILCLSSVSSHDAIKIQIFQCNNVIHGLGELVSQILD